MSFLNLLFCFNVSFVLGDIRVVILWYRHFYNCAQVVSYPHNHVYEYPSVWLICLIEHRKSVIKCLNKCRGSLTRGFSHETYYELAQLKHILGIELKIYRIKLRIFYPKKWKLVKTKIKNNNKENRKLLLLILRGRIEQLQYLLKPSSSL